jgi:hypothetical protein
VPVGATGHRPPKPAAPEGPSWKLGPPDPGPHPAQPSSSLDPDPGGERWAIPRPLAPLIAQLVGAGAVVQLLLQTHTHIYSCKCKCKCTMCYVLGPGPPGRHFLRLLLMPMKRFTTRTGSSSTPQEWLPSVNRSDFPQSTPLP